MSRGSEGFQALTLSRAQVLGRAGVGQGWPGGRLTLAVQHGKAVHHLGGGPGGLHCLQGGNRHQSEGGDTSHASAVVCAAQSAPFCPLPETNMQAVLHCPAQLLHSTLLRLSGRMQSPSSSTR